MATSIALKTAKQSEDPMLQWVTFRLENEIYGVNVMQVKEVLRYSEIAPVPGAPNFVLGIIHLRGTVVTVIDTCQRFDLPSGEITDATRIMILEVEGHVIGILVDASPNVGNDESSKFIQGVCHKNDILLILVDLDKLLSEDDWSEVGSM
jgi:purine-binding chemotaxis protein CheW